MKNTDTAASMRRRKKTVAETMTTTSPLTKQISVYLTPETARAIKTYAAGHDTNVSRIVQDLLDDFLSHNA